MLLLLLTFKKRRKDCSSDGSCLKWMIPKKESYEEATSLSSSGFLHWDTKTSWIKFLTFSPKQPRRLGSNSEVDEILLDSTLPSESAIYHPSPQEESYIGKCSPSGLWPRYMVSRKILCNVSLWQMLYMGYWQNVQCIMVTWCSSSSSSPSGRMDQPHYVIRLRNQLHWTTFIKNGYNRISNDYSYIVVPPHPTYSSVN